MTTVAEMNRMTARRWEAWEDDLIRQHYAHMDLVELAAMLPDDRNVKRLKDRAHKLGVRRGRHPKPEPINAEEPYILKTFYRYLETAKRVAAETGCHPDVECMMKTFRTVYSSLPQK